MTRKQRMDSTIDSVFRRHAGTFKRLTAPRSGEVWYCPEHDNFHIIVGWGLDSGDVYFDVGDETRWCRAADLADWHFVGVL